MIPMRWRIPILLGIMIVGAWLRFAPLQSRSLWLDEAISAHDLSLPYQDAFLKAIGPGPLHPPLHSLALRLWSTLWGSSEFALRSLAALAGTATILGLYLLVVESTRLDREHAEASDAGAILAAAMVALSPLQIELSQMVRGYSLAAALLIFGTWAALKAMNRPEHSDFLWGLSALLLVASCYTHNLTILSVVCLGLYIAIILTLRTLRASSRSDRPGLEVDSTVSQKPRTLRGVMLASALFGVVYLIPWLPHLMRQGEHLRSHSLFQGPSTFSRAAAEVSVAMFGTPDAGWIPPGEMSLAIVALLLTAFALLALRGRPSDWFWVQSSLLPTLLIGAFSSVSLRSIFAARYLSFVMLSWLASLAVLAVATPTRVGKLLACLALLEFSAVSCQGNWERIGPASKPGIRAAIRFIEGSRRADEPVIVQSPFIYFGAAYYARTVQPQMCIDKDRRGKAFGHHNLAPHEKIGVKAVLGLGTSGVWLIDTDAYKPSQAVRFDIPSHWIQQGHWSFQQDRYLEKPPVNVRHYRIQR